VPPKPLLQIRGLTKSYGPKKIFDEASVNIHEKQRIGVIGRNGAGKTTLFKMILGKEEPDYGEIAHMPDLRLGYIEQHDPFEPGETILQFLERYTGKPEWECAKTAAQFQLKGEQLSQTVSSLSGGYQMRVKLTATLLFEPNLLLLDEPTNFLDLSTLILLENFLRNFRGAFMVITHDREFIKRTAESILDVENGQLFFYPEPLEDYLEFKETQKSSAQTTNLSIERKQKQLQTFVERFGAKASMAAAAQNKLKQIARLDERKISIEHPFSRIKMRIPKVEAKVGNAVVCKNLSIGYGAWAQKGFQRESLPSNLETDINLKETTGKGSTSPEKSVKIVASDISLEIERGQKVAILGDNGQGKSTLLKTLAGQLAPITGKCGWQPNLKITYYDQLVHQALPMQQTVFEYLKEVSTTGKDEDIYEMLGNFLFGKPDYTKPIAVLSGGEKARLCLAGMFLNKADVYLLDEPTNHLDFETVEAMGTALREFNGTVFVVSHDRTFVNLLATDILEVKNGQVKRILGDYESYVWRLEQEAQNLNNSSSSSQSAKQKEGSNHSQLPPGKEERKRLYALRKELSKIERKLDKLKTARDLDPTNWQNHADLETHENRWLEVQEEIDRLGGSL
jgi:ATP-binding cassette, subfamily F, member 3